MLKFFLRIIYVAALGSLLGIRYLSCHEGSFLLCMVLMVVIGGRRGLSYSMAYGILDS